MSVPGYYGCDCDKYNPDCRCYPRTAKPVPPGTALREAVARAMDDNSFLDTQTGQNGEELIYWGGLHTLDLADAAIAAVLDHLIAVDERQAEASLARDFAGKPFTMHADWLRSFREAVQ